MKTLLRAGTLVLALSVPCVTGRPATAEDEIAENLRWAEQAFSDGQTLPPFSFVYGGRASSELIGGWQRTVEDRKLDDNRRQRVLTLTDPETGLEVRAVATIYTDTPGVDWTLYFTNRGKPTRRSSSRSGRST